MEDLRQDHGGEDDRLDDTQLTVVPGVAEPVVAQEKGGECPGGNSNALPQEPALTGQRQDVLSLFSGRVLHDVRLRRLHAEGECRQPIGHQVYPQDLHRDERQREPGYHGDEHRQDLADIAGEEEVDGLLQVAEDYPPLAHRGNDGGEVVIRQHHVACFLGDISPGDAHGNTDIGGLERRGIVHPVTGHGDYVIFRLQGLHDLDLVMGGNARVHSDASDFFGQLVRGQPVEITTLDELHTGGEHSQFAAYRLGGGEVISGHHRNPDVRISAGFQRLERLRPRRVHHGEGPHEREARLHRLRRYRVRQRFQVTVGERDRPEGVAPQLRRLLEDPAPLLGGELYTLTV